MASGPTTEELIAQALAGGDTSTNVAVTTTDGASLKTKAASGK